MEQRTGSNFLGQIFSLSASLASIRHFVSASHPGFQPGERVTGSPATCPRLKQLLCLGRRDPFLLCVGTEPVCILGG